MDSKLDEQDSIGRAGSDSILDDSFTKFKRKALKEHLLKSIIFAFAAGLFGSAVCVGLSHLLYNKFIVILLSSVGVGFFLFVGVFLLVFFIGKPSDYQIARRLDSQLNLHEKAATMVKYKNEDSAILSAQRTQTLGELKSRSIKSFKMKFAVFTVPMLAIAMCLFGASFAIPQTSVLSPVDNPTNNPDNNGQNQNWDQNTVDDETKSGAQSMQDMIAQSDADPRLQAIYSQLVEQLENDLEGESDTEKRTELVQEAEDKVYEYYDMYTSKEEIGDVLERYEADGVSSATLKFIHNFGAKAIYKGDYRYASIYVSDLIDDIYEMSDTQAMADELTAFADSLRAGVKADNADSLTSQGLDDYMISILDQIAQECYDYAEKFPSAADLDSCKKDFESEMNELEANLESVCVMQKGNEDLRDGLIKEMEKLIDPQDQQQQQQEQKEEEEEEDSDEDQQDGDNQGQSGQGQSGDKSDQHSDGATKGNGDDYYGSNDRIFTKDGYSEYGDVIENYFTNAINDSNTEADSELTSIVEEYYNNLYGSQKP